MYWPTQYMLSVKDLIMKLERSILLGSKPIPPDQPLRVDIKTLNTRKNQLVLPQFRPCSKWLNRSWI